MSDVIIIPGAASVGVKPNKRFKERLDKSLKIIKPDSMIIVSGRAGASLSSLEHTEAEIGKNYLVSNGVRNQIIMETSSVESLGNFLFSLLIIQELDIDEIKIVTSVAVAKRFELYARKFLRNKKYTLIICEDPGLAYLEREQKAQKMYGKLLALCSEDPLKGINMLLTKTPFYNKGHITDSVFFDEFWDGGFEDYLQGRDI